MRTALITGGTKGIGKQIAVTFRAGGWQTVVCARNAPEEPCGGLFIPCDLADEEDIGALCRQVRTNPGHVDALILNAGMGWDGLIQDMPCGVFDEMYRVNLRSAFLLVKAFLPEMISRKNGSVVFVSSMWGQVGASCETAYSAFKAALIGFCRALAKETGPSGVRVNCVCPGFVETDMTRHYPAEVRQQMIDETPLSRLCTPQDCADAVWFLCSDRASFITGQAISVSGGLVV